jgi:hypothetical protein
MTADRAQYIPFLDLAEQWAAQSGIPREIVLRHQCDWAVASAFPPNAFTTVTGAQIKPFDIYMSFRAAFETKEALGEGIYLDGWTIYNSNGRWGLHLLSEVLVPAQDIIEFCARTNTLAPRSLRGIWAGWNRNKHLSPPPCPDGYQHAARIHARDFAIGSMNHLRLTLADLQGDPTPDPNRTLSKHIDINYWERRWNEGRARAQENIIKSGDSSLQTELDSLSTTWVALLAKQASARALPAVEVSKGAKTENKTEAPYEGMTSHGKRLGRPVGSGSYAAADAPLVARMREAMLNDPGLSPTAAAGRFADCAKGGGTPDSKAKRLAERYSEKFGLNQPPNSDN